MVNSPSGCISRKRDATAVQHTSVVQSDVRIIGTNGKQFWSYGIDAETLGFSMRTDVLVQVDQHVLRPISLAHLWSTQVKLPAILQHKPYTKRINETKFRVRAHHHPPKSL